MVVDDGDDMPVALELALLARAYSAPDAWRVITKVAYFAGLVGMLGSTSLLLFVLRPILVRSDAGERTRATLYRRSALLLAGVGIWSIVALYGQLAATVARAPGASIPFTGALAPGAIGRYLAAPGRPDEWISTGGQLGIRFALMGIAALVLAALAVPRLRAHMTAAAGTALALAVIGQQVGYLPRDVATARGAAVATAAVTDLHVMSMSIWIGGLAGLVTLAAAGRHLAPDAGAAWARLWTRFSVVALTAVGVVVLTGLYLTWQRVGGVGELVTTTYGRILLLKMLLVAGMVAIGAANEFLLIPRIAHARATGDTASVLRLALGLFPRMVTVELTLSVLVLAVVAFLAGSARSEAGDGAASVDAGAVGIGVLLVAMVALSLVGAARFSAALSRASAPGEPEPAVD